MATVAPISLGDTTDGAAHTVPRPRWRSFVEHPLVRRFAYGAAWNTLANAASRVLLLVAMIGAARILGRELQGRLGTVQNTMGLFGVLAGFGLGISTTKFVAEFRRTDQARAGRIMAFTQLFAVASGIAFSALCWLLAPLLATHVLAEPALTGALQIGAGLVALNVLNGVQHGALVGLEAFRPATAVQSIGGIGSVVFVIGGACLGGLTGALWGLVLTALVQTTASQFAVRLVARAAQTPLRFHDAHREAGRVLSYAWPLAFAALTVFPTEWAVTAMLVNQPGGYAEMGLYTTATQWFNAVVLIPSIIGQAVLPMLSERWAAGDRRGHVRLMLLAMAANAAIVLPLVILGWFGSGLVMQASGPEFAVGAPVLCTLLFAALVMAVQTPLGNSMQANGKAYIGMWMNLAWSLCYLTIAWFTVDNGAQGVAYARLSAYLIHTIWLAVFAWWLLRANHRPPHWQQATSV